MTLRAKQLPAPAYSGRDRKSGPRVGLAVESMKRHMTDEGWQLFAGLESAGYDLFGHGVPPDSETRVHKIVKATQPLTLVLQDKREWDVKPGNFRDQNARFVGVDLLKSRDEVFKLTVLKDSHHSPMYHRSSAAEIGCHAWIVYYSPEQVCRLAPFVRPEHLVRTYHTVDSDLVPEFGVGNRGGCLLSGAVSVDVYPLRTRLVNHANKLPDTVVLPHPGYHRDKCHTPDYLKTLSRFKVVVCTCSIYKYALRKMFEATACGCVVLTDLPEDEVLPEVDANLVRVSPTCSVEEAAHTISHLVRTYNPDRQEYFARRARCRYDYRVEGTRLALEIEKLRLSYEGD